MKNTPSLFLLNLLYRKVPITLERNYMKELTSISLEDVIQQTLTEMKSEQSNDYPLDRVNLSKLERSTSVSRAKLRWLKENRFIQRPYEHLGLKRPNTHLVVIAHTRTSCSAKVMPTRQHVWNDYRPSDSRSSSSTIKQYLKPLEHFIPTKC